MTNQDLQQLADRTDTGRTNPVRAAAIRRFLEHLPPGPFTQAELHAELEQLDLNHLADSTATAYRSAIRTFIRLVEDPRHRGCRNRGT